MSGPALRVVVTLVAMVLVFFGLRGVVADIAPGWESGWGEVAIYVISGLYGTWFSDWLGKRWARGTP